jgi:hypothetical protein
MRRHKTFDLNNIGLLVFFKQMVVFNQNFENRVKTTSPKCRTEVRVVIQLDKRIFLLQFMKDHWVGIGYRAKQATYYYSSVTTIVFNGFTI